VTSVLVSATRLDAVRRSGIVDTERETVFDELTKAAAQLLRAPYALISIMDERYSFWKSTYGLPLSMRSENVSDSFCQYVVERQQDLFTDDVRVDEATKANPTIEAKGVRAWAGCPVELDGEVLGTFCVIDRDVREWTVEDRQMLRALAAIASREIALRAELRAAESAAAKATTESARIHTLLGTIRSSLLPPSLPEIDGVDLDAWFSAADDGDTLLGDFYDVFPLGERRWGLVVGDVCGHGVEAAKLTSLVRYSLRSAAVHHHDLANVMAEVDVAIRTDTLDQGRFVTVAYFDIDTSNDVRVRWTRAGHPFPLRVSSTGAVAPCIGADGPPLGITSAPGPTSWSVGEFTLLPGERLVVHTDGLTDAQSSETGERLGDEGLLALVSTIARAEDRNDLFLARLTEEAMTTYRVHADDIAIVVLHATV
jgi:phosphoserine phosphatase RsbU/P